MQGSLIPLFPLDVVLLPFSVLPLHIFEDRYKEMIASVIAENLEFGVVQANQKGILNIGCTASIQKVVSTYPDGRMDIIAVGRRRFEVLELDESRSYLQAGVSFFDDEDLAEPGSDSKTMALACFEMLKSQQQIEADTPLDSDPGLSFKIAAIVPDLSFRQTLLAMRSEVERLVHINRFLPNYLAALRRSMHVREVAPKNGHGFVATGKRP